MKKLLYTCFSGFPTPDTGGPNKVIYQLLYNLDLDKFNVSYLSKHSNFDYLKSDRNNQLSNKINRKAKTTFSLFNKCKLYRSLVTNPIYLNLHYSRADRYFNSKINYVSNFDVIHSHDPRSLLFFCECKAKKILTIHSKGSVVRDMKDYLNGSSLLDNLYAKLTEIELKALSIADIVTFPSKAAKILYLSQLNLNDDPKYRVIYNGIDIDEINNTEFDPSLLNRFHITDHYDIKILNIAEHIKVKNIDKIIEIINILKKDYCKNPLFVNIGKGPETNNLISMVKEFGLEENIKFLGSLKNIEILSFMKWFDIFILLSERVIFDMVILEALASGLKVIASDDGGNKEVIRNGENGFLVNLLDFQHIIDIVMSFRKTKKGEINPDIFDVKMTTENYSRLY
ncbi:MAG: glycosyltransferase family 4 protein [Ignavibacteriaceae bacterium]